MTKEPSYCCLSFSSGIWIPLRPIKVTFSWSFYRSWYHEGLVRFDLKLLRELKGFSRWVIADRGVTWGSRPLLSLKKNFKKLTLFKCKGQFSLLFAVHLKRCLPLLKQQNTSPLHLSILAPDFCLLNFPCAAFALPLSFQPRTTGRHWSSGENQYLVAWGLPFLSVKSEESIYLRVFLQTWIVTEGSCERKPSVVMFSVMT